WTLTVSSTSTRSVLTVPACGDSTSRLTLSVMTSAMTSPCWIVSPTALRQATRVPDRKSLASSGRVTVCSWLMRVLRGSVDHEVCEVFEKAPGGNAVDDAVVVGEGEWNDGFHVPALRAVVCHHPRPCAAHPKYARLPGRDDGRGPDRVPEAAIVAEREGAAADVFQLELAVARQADQRVGLRCDVRHALAAGVADDHGLQVAVRHGDGQRHVDRTVFVDDALMQRAVQQPVTIQAVGRQMNHVVGEAGFDPAGAPGVLSFQQSAHGDLGHGGDAGGLVPAGR